MSTPADTMKITISHTQSSIDPAGTYSDEEFPAVRRALEKAYVDAILTQFPYLEIEFRDEDTTYSVRFNGSGEEAEELEVSVQDICESVFETGNFWV
jgi:hypothetical protein